MESIRRNTTATKQHKLVTVNNWILMSLGFRAQASCVNVEVAVLGSLSLFVLHTVSVGVQQH